MKFPPHRVSLVQLLPKAPLNPWPSTHETCVFRTHPIPSPACEDRLQQVEQMKPLLSPMVKKAVSEKMVLVLRPCQSIGPPSIRQGEASRALGRGCEALIGEGEVPVLCASVYHQKKAVCRGKRGAHGTRQPGKGAHLGEGKL